MKGLIQRVQRASVLVDGELVGEIDKGILLLLGIEKGDTETHSQKLLEKIINYRIFPDEKGRMGKSLLDINGSLLVVSQFTLVADTSKGRKPSFSSAADPGLSKDLYRFFLAQAEQKLGGVQSGEFGADMQVALVNDGPVTFLLEV
jgi:D-tyrosyl-tRNA(Tyr) deacylase